MNPKTCKHKIIRLIGNDESGLRAILCEVCQAELTRTHKRNPNTRVDDRDEPRG